MSCFFCVLPTGNDFYYRVLCYYYYDMMKKQVMWTCMDIFIKSQRHVAVVSFSLCQAVEREGLSKHIDGFSQVD